MKGWVSVVGNATPLMQPCQAILFATLLLDFGFNAQEKRIKHSVTSGRDAFSWIRLSIST